MDFDKIEKFLTLLPGIIKKNIQTVQMLFKKFVQLAMRVIARLIIRAQPVVTRFLQLTQPIWSFLAKYIFKPKVNLYSQIIESKRTVSKTIFRYVMMEALFSFFICFLFFFFIFFVNQILLLAKDVLSKHVPFSQVALLIFFSLPMVIAMAAPFASLVGTLMTVGRLASDNEVLVMLSSGLSYKNIFFPAITVGIIISLMSFFTNDVLLPAGNVQYSKLWRKIIFSTPTLELEANSVKRFKDTIIVTGDAEKNTINNVLILDKTSDGERRIILAASAELKDSGKGGLNLDLDNAFIQSSGEIAREDYDYASTDFLQYWVSNKDIIQAITSISPREMSSRDVKTAIKTRNEELAIRENEAKGKVAYAALALENILRDGPVSEAWNKRTGNIANLNRETSALYDIKKDKNLGNLLIEYYRKFSIPFGAFFFVFLAVSLGLMAKKSGQTVGFIFGVLISVVYWSMIFIGQTLGLRVGTPPFWSMWLPNIISLGVGVILAVIRVRR